MSVASDFNFNFNDFLLLTANCPTGYQLYNNVCYKYFPGPVNWVQAAEKCVERFSTLASIESQAEEFFIRTVLVSYALIRTRTLNGVEMVKAPFIWRKLVLAGADAGPG